MNPFRRCRSPIALVALASLLFAQVALAWYECLPAERTGSVATVAMETEGTSAMPDCEGMHEGQPALCQAHCQPVTQSLDRPHAPDIPPFVKIGYAVAVTLDPGAPVSRPLRPESCGLARAASPPIAVLNCCFRI
jgi:hypothetical protein